MGVTWIPEVVLLALNLVL